VSEQIPDWKQAREAFQHSLALFAALRDAGKLSKQDLEEPERVAVQIAKCDEQIGGHVR
jgi:hypothetical protein